MYWVDYSARVLAVDSNVAVEEPTHDYSHLVVVVVVVVGCFVVQQVNVPLAPVNSAVMCCSDSAPFVAVDYSLHQLDSQVVALVVAAVGFAGVAVVARSRSPS